MKALLRLWCAWALLGLATGAAATQRALLVGVTQLEHQPTSLWLQAPRNDVLLMRQALLRQGFAAPDVALLADGVPGARLPDSAGIRDAFERLLNQSRSGDFVLLYFSGHGTRMRNTSKRYQEPDGLAENFLARDARAAPTADAVLPGSIRDVDFDRWIGALLAKNVFVWAVYDTCSAASMTRSARATAPRAQPVDDEVLFRGIQADTLAQAPTGVTPVAQPVSLPDVRSVPRARYVAFFASESHQVTPELRLPRRDRNGQPQGLLTWALSEALQRNPATWRELFNGVLALYPAVIEELEARFPERELPSPVAEGNLDQPLFGNPAIALSTRPPWRARRVGSALALEVGLLDGLEPGLPVRVQATLADGTLRSVLDQLPNELSASDALLELPATLAALAGVVQWSVTPTADPPSSALRVLSERELPPGISLAFPASITRVRAGEPADIRVTALLSGAARIEVLGTASAELAELASSGVWTAGGMVLASQAALRDQLQALARLAWLMRLHKRAADSRMDGFSASLEVWRGERLLRSLPLEAGQALAAPAPGEQWALAVRNSSGASLDLVALGIDERGALIPIFPQDIGETNRFERGSAERPAAKRFALPWVSPAANGRLLVVASAAAPQSAPRLFGIGLADGQADLRLRGQLNPARERALFASMVRWGNPSHP